MTVLLLLAAAILGGMYAAVSVRRYWLARAAEPAAELVSLERDFPDAAFGPDATVEEIRQVAERAVDELLVRYPQLVDVQYLKAHLCLMLEQPAAAAEAWRYALLLDPLDVNAYVSLATLLTEREQVTEAIQLLRQAMACESKDPRVPGLLAEALFKQGEVQEATELLQRQVSRREATNAAVILLGQCYLQQQDYQRAATTSETAVAASPDSAKAHYTLAMACQKLGRTEQARQHLARFEDLQRAERAARAREMETYSDLDAMREIAAETLVDAGRVYLAQGEPAQAEQLLLKASRFDELDPDCWELLVLLYETTQRPGEGLVACEKLCEIDPGNAAYWLNVAMLQGRLLRREQALAAVEKALELSPQDPECQRVYAILQKSK